MRTVALIYAGNGRGPGAAAAGLLTPLAGRPVVGHSVAAFAAAPQVDEIMLVAAPPVAAREYRRAARIIEGAGSRARSVYRAIEAVGRAGCGLLVHDACWPLISQRVIDDCIAALRDGQAACAAIPVSDTMVAVTGDVITERPARDRLRRRQYPQGFRLPVIRRGYQLALADPSFQPVDDCGIVLRYLPEVPVRLVPGSQRAFPVTSPLDLGVAEALLAGATTASFRMERPSRDHDAEDLGPPSRAFLFAISGGCVVGAGAPVSA